MIPESKGATPFGIFVLANSFLSAAITTHADSRISSNGPTRLLCYHACELFLKSFLRAKGQDIETLRNYSHNIHQMAVGANGRGLGLPDAEVAVWEQLAKKNDYVRVRYMVVEVPGDVKIKRLMALTLSIKLCVRTALGMDEFGMPLG